MISIFECCGGRYFVSVPLIGLLEARFTAGVTLFVSLVVTLLWAFRKYWLKILAALTIVSAIVLQVVVSSSGNENGVKGWMQALDMAKVDVDSDALRHWIQEQVRKETSPRTDSSSFDLAEYRHPKRIKVLSKNESATASQLLFDDRDSWIHMDRRAGPLPSFIYGTYYQYNSHNKPFPTPKDVRDAYKRFQTEGNPITFQGSRATSTISYCDEHGVQHYNHKQRQLFAKLNLHERLRKAISKAIGMPVKYHAHWGLPGVHITFSHKIMEYNIFQAHVDGAYSPITAEFQQPGRQCVPFHRLSVTLTLQVPSDGAGLNMHIFNDQNPGCNSSMFERAQAFLQLEQEALYNKNVKAQEKLAQSKEEMRTSLGDALACLDPIYEEYVVGEAVIHSGAVIHSVAPWKYNKPGYDDARITLQGFAFLCDGVWHLHW